MVDAESLTSATVFDSAEEELGAVVEVFTNSSDDTPAWVAVELDGRRVAVPLDGAEVGADEVRVRFSRDTIAGAPEASGDALTPDDETTLYDHYGISDADMRDDNTGLTFADKAGQDSSRDPAAGGADDATQGHP